MKNAFPLLLLITKMTSQLQLHLDTLAANFPDDGNSSVTIFDIKDYILGLLPGERSLISEVCTVLKLVLVMSSTNAMSEHHLVL